MKDSKLIFLGDSLTMRHNWSSFKADNMGIDGDTTAGVLSRLHQSSKAQRVVLMVGVNDILNQLPLITIQKNYLKILNALPDEQKVYVLSLLPVIDAKETKSINQNIKTINRWLKEELKKRSIPYINLYPEFLDQRKQGLDRSFTSDGIHLTPKAYKVWENILRPVLSED